MKPAPTAVPTPAPAPTPATDAAPTADTAPAADASASDAEASPLPPAARRPMRPIGPEGLKALRDAIRSGAYPSDDVVRDGLERLIRRPR